jgi:cell division protein FtsL
MAAKIKPFALIRSRLSGLLTKQKHATLETNAALSDVEESVKELKQTTISRSRLLLGAQVCFILALCVGALIVLEASREVKQAEMRVVDLEANVSDLTGKISSQQDQLDRMEKMVTETRNGQRNMMRELKPLSSDVRALTEIVHTLGR